MFPFLKRKKDITPDEIMYKLYKKKDKRVKNLEKIKYNGKGTRIQEMANECIQNILDLNHDLHFNTRDIIFAYSMDEEFKDKLIEIQHYLYNEIILDNEGLSKIDKLNTINTSIITNVEGLHHGQYFYAKIMYFYNILKDYKDNESEIFNELLNEYEFINYYLISLNNYIVLLNDYYKNEYRE